MDFFISHKNLPFGDINGEDGREVFIMTNKENKSIGCTVTDCKYHCKSAEYCTLDKIQVGECGCHPTESDETCCRSFEME